MLGRLLLLFILIPLIELVILIDIGRIIGTGSTILLIVCTGVIGAYLARSEGMKTLYLIQNKLQSGQIPADEMLDGLIILIAGAVLLTPGILTDIFGFLLLFPQTRTYFKTWLKKKLSVHVTTFRSHQPPFDE